MRLCLLLALLPLSFVVVACDGAECSTDEAECDADGQIRTCDGGSWTAWEECPDPTACMTMDDGVTHCMEAM